MLTALELGVAAAAVYAIVFMVLLSARAQSLGKREMHSRPAGESEKGVFYAFGKGMTPWEKESAKKHLPTYFAGIGYHIGIFTAFVVLLFRLISVNIPFLNVFRILLVSGLAAGSGLLIKRLSKQYMRTISLADDYISNLLVDIFLFAAFLNTWNSVVLPFLYFSAIALLVYIPLGKIRHCLFFFYSRIIFGKFFGRRGVYPHKRRV